MSFKNGVSGPPCPQFFDVGRIVESSPGCYTRVEPSVENVGFSSCLAAAFAPCLDLVYAVPVEFEISWTINCYLLQLCPGPYYSVLSTFLAGPDRERCSPVALSADDPVTRTNEPCVEPFGPSPFRSPSDLFVLPDHFLFEFGDFDEPLVGGS